MLAGMRVTMLLADHAVVAEGKLYVNGGGWSIRPAGPTQMFLALKFDVPWDLAGRPIEVELRLVDEDGHLVAQRTPQGDQPVLVNARLEVQRPPGLTPGAPIDAAMAIGVPPFGLPPGRRYSWRLSVDGHQREDWVIEFATRPEA
jgi:hypothetical protein